jgi:formyltetrahydrofolate synthetase
LEEELQISERVIRFARSLDKNDDSLWNITDGSPKIKNFKEHFGDEFNIKSSELRELLDGFTR